MSSQTQMKHDQNCCVYKLSSVEAKRLVALRNKCVKKATDRTPSIDRFIQKTAEMNLSYMKCVCCEEQTYNDFQRIARILFAVMEELNENGNGIGCRSDPIRIEEISHLLPVEFQIAYKTCLYLDWAIHTYHSAFETNQCSLCEYTGTAEFYYDDCNMNPDPTCDKCDIEMSCLRDEELSGEVEEEEIEERVLQIKRSRMNERAAQAAKLVKAEPSMTSRYMNFSPQLVNERNRELNKCETKAGRSAIYKAYYFKMKEAFDKAEVEDETETEEDEEDEEDEEYVVSEEDDEEEDDSASETEVGEEEDLTDIDEADQSEADPSEADPSEAAEEEPTGECCECDDEWEDGWRKGWKAAMKHISKYAIKNRREIPPTCENCGNLHQLRTCGGCNEVKYCSTECQKEHWRAQHKYDCQ